MNINLWVSTDETANWLIDNTVLENYEVDVKELVESDAVKPNSFNRLPEPIKKILYLDAVDIIIEINRKPVLAVEITHEAGTGHNSFQRFSRIVAAAENNIPVAYIYPEAAFIHRSKSDRWDRINPNIFRALEKVMQIHNSPALLFYYPTEFSNDYNKPPSTSKGLINDDKYFSSPSADDDEIKDFFSYVNLIINKTIDKDDDLLLINNKLVSDRRDWMQEQFILKGGKDKNWSPDTATISVPTSSLLKYLRKYSGEDYEFGDLLTSRNETLIYKVNAKFRGDPYPGALTALDYLNTRIGENIEDRDKNLVMAWGNLKYDANNNEIIITDAKTSINDFMESVSKVSNKKNCLLSYTKFDDLDVNSVARYYMQVNHSCNFTKKKEIRVYSSFADAILFKDGCLWKDG